MLVLNIAVYGAVDIGLMSVCLSICLTVPSWKTRTTKLASFAWVSNAVGKFNPARDQRTFRPCCPRADALIFYTARLRYAT